MRRWGIVISTFYLFVVVALLMPLAEYLADFGDLELPEALFDLGSLASGAWIAWIFLGSLAAAQFLLLFLSVDVSRKRLRPRQHVLLSVAVIAFATGLLSFAFLISVFAAARLDGPFNTDWGSWMTLFGGWGFWAVLFYLYRERVSARLDRTVSWLLNGSVLQLLIAVPCHVVVRQRGECSAPIATGFGIATGIAIMLMAFGPSVVFLYQKRMREVGRPAKAEPLAHRWPIRKGLLTLTAGALTLFIFLPLDDELMLGLAFPRERSSEANAAVAAIAAIAERFGTTVLRGENSGFEILCDGASVARVTASLASGETGEVWNIRLRADQEELFDALQTLAEKDGTDRWSTEGPPAFEKWRAKMLTGAYFGRGCRPR
jgi:hypothetical protein